MVSKASDSGTKPRLNGEQSNEGVGNLVSKINLLRKQIQAERNSSVKEKFEKNGKKVEDHVCQLLSEASKNDGFSNILLSRIENPLGKFSAYVQGSGDKDGIYGHELSSLVGTKLPYTEKLPPYTTWIFLDRNQRMAEDQSVVGRRRIYYDQHGSEALICSDSEEDMTEPEDEKHDFSEAEDRILWMAFEEYGSSEDVQNIVSQFVGGTKLEIQERYKFLKENYEKKQNKNLKNSGDVGTDKGIYLDKTLSAALDSFDNLFCRRCLLFDCRLHGCSQSLIIPGEKQPYSLEHEEDGKPCGDQCYLKDCLQLSKFNTIKASLECSDIDDSNGVKRETLREKEESMGSSSAAELVIADHSTGIAQVHEQAIPSSSKGVDEDPQCHTSVIGLCTEITRKCKDIEKEITPPQDPKLISDDFAGSPVKKQKILLSPHPDVSSKLEFYPVIVDAAKESTFSDSGKLGFSGSPSSDKTEDLIINEEEDVVVIPASVQTSNNTGEQGTMRDEGNVVAEAHKEKQKSNEIAGERMVPICEWKPIEKELYTKGVEIFGKNSCLIARNMLSGLKTCMEVSSYMHDVGPSISNRSGAAPSSCLEDNGNGDMDHATEEMPTKTRLLRRRGRTRKLKYSWKSAGHPSIWKRIADGKNRSCKQFTPCGCQFMCGKQCTCLRNGTCCEKYCGCSKSCKNRFRGCHCAKSQCRSRQCPCFAAGRECDPDVCRNCWVSCGDGSLGEPPRRGEGQCGNMRLLLRQQQRILLAKSDVAGWGAFLKNPVNRNDYLGEYTGELISHREADKRGKIYDRANSSFLFDLNDQFLVQYVLDAFRKGDKLKFANHSSNPNCYAKVMLVAGDHRVGIFAKEHIEASEELFYDYRYGPDQAPAWARRPESSKRDDLLVSQGRAKKHQ
ncbi:histone-lysine N-methyltransferase EZA1 isoform X2 [Rhodamnia argentea]|uniref:[histone H3]-lysine(27) N-trimethyltransferase n=1 Tax=Rhodamnia argentea TaxID=178133 RepID=A0ABM3HDF7_9MYRT|nr:histone-lysine N-methyltransferase EZA1 isoform X2 [Rhodamnia argentea]